MGTLTIREHEPLSRHTTLEVGGPARYWVDVASEDELGDALAWARARDLPTSIVGGGSNLLVSDRGFEGLAIRIAIRGVAVLSREAGCATIDVGAGEALDAFVERAVSEGWQGVECLSGIPGYVGATPIQNVGAYGQEIAASLVTVRALDRATGTPETLDAAACQLAYRDSAFKGRLRGRHVIVRVVLSLRPGAAPAIRHGELSRFLAEQGLAAPTLADVRAAVLALRRAKSMVWSASDANRRSAGSFFTNPLVSDAHADTVAACVGADGATMPRYEVGPGITKLSAAWLIEHAGFHRGHTEGSIGLSTRHALAIVNRGGATAAELVSFASRVRARVLAAFDVTLHPEPELLGFTADELRDLA